MATEAPLRVQLVHAWPDRAWSHELELPLGACVGDALLAAGRALDAAGIDLTDLGLAVFGRAADRGSRLHDGDRIELLRPLLASPRDARANRAAASRRRSR